MINQTSDNPFRFDIQLFADELSEEQQAELMAMFEEPEGAGEVPNEEPLAPPVEQPVTGELPPEAGPAPVAQPDIMAKLREQGLDKFKSEDDFIKSYKEMEKLSTRTSQEIAQLKQQLATPNTAPEDAPEDEFAVLDDEEKYQEMLYENPWKLKQLENKRNKKMLDDSLRPYQEKEAKEKEKMEWAQTVNEFADAHPDLDTFRDDMAKILMENPELKRDPKGLEIAYNAAKGTKYQEPADPKTFLEDEAFVSENVVKNDKIRQRIIQEYLQGLEKGEAPITIGNQSGSKIPLTPRKEPKSMDEANDQLLSMLEK